MVIKMQIKNYIFILTLALSFYSCNRIKKNGNEMVGKAKESVIEKKNEVFEEIIPTFDSYTADTRSNKKRFKEFLALFQPTTSLTFTALVTKLVLIQNSYFPSHATIQRKIRSLTF